MCCARNCSEVQVDRCEMSRDGKPDLGESDRSRGPGAQQCCARTKARWGLRKMLNVEEDSFVATLEDDVPFQF
jgi:hypothetical protein